MDPSLEPVQSALAATGRYAGAIDGIMGPMTMRGLMMAASGVHAPTQVMVDIAPAIVAILPIADLTTPLRLCHFLAQTTEETADWATLVEYGDEAYFSQYDNRFGNSAPGDGFKYRGRGPLMLTFKSNYQSFGEQIGVDLIDSPDLVSTDMTVSAQTACAFWLDRKANAAADADNLDEVTRLINGGVNGLPMRQNDLNRLKALWGTA